MAKRNEENIKTGKGARRKINIASISKSVSLQEIASGLGMNKGTFYNTLQRDTMRYNEVEKIANFLGYDLVFYDRKTGEII